MEDLPNTRIFPRLIEIISKEIKRHEYSLAENLRAAAWYVKEEFSEARSSDFGHAAAACGLHRQAAMNRWTEAMKNWEIAHGR